MGRNKKESLSANTCSRANTQQSGKLGDLSTHLTSTVLAGGPCGALRVHFAGLLPGSFLLLGATVSKKRLLFVGQLQLLRGLNLHDSISGPVVVTAAVVRAHQ